jgi:hypothetical protein
MSEICTILGLVRFEAKNSKHIFPRNERNYSGNKHKCPSVRTQMRALVQVNIKFQNKHKSNRKMPAKSAI